MLHESPVDFFGKRLSACDAGDEECFFLQVARMRKCKLILEEVIGLLWCEVYIVRIVASKVWNHVGDEAGEGEFLSWSGHFEREISTQRLGLL